jgi:pimeloyl-ACP methyl ester carboxylesterase
VSLSTHRAPIVQPSGRVPNRQWANSVADDVQSVVLAGSGHGVAEQAPEQLLAALTEFLAPYRDAALAAA